MKHLPQALDRNGDLWVPAETRNLVFRALQDARMALQSAHGLEASKGKTTFTIDHAAELDAMAEVERLLGLADSDRLLPPVHVQLGQPSAMQSVLMRNLYKLHPV